MQGWISLHRQIIENEFYFAERFTKMQAWIDILLLANHKPCVIFIRGNELKLTEGQLAYSQLSLAKRWKWNFKTVKKFLEMLEQRNMITVSGGKITTVISILNYSKYQNSGEQIEPIISTANTIIQTPDGEQNGEQMENRTEIDNNANNVSNVINAREHEHALLKKPSLNPKNKKGNWRHRKRNENEKVLITKDMIQKFFSREINRRDLDEMNNIAEKYGIGTPIELLNDLTDKIYSTNIWDNDIIEATSKEMIYRAKVYQDLKNEITKADLNKGKIDQKIIAVAKEVIDKKKIGPEKKPTKLNLIQDVYKESFNDKEYSQKNAVC